MSTKQRHSTFEHDNKNAVIGAKRNGGDGNSADHVCVFEFSGAS